MLAGDENLRISLNEQKKLYENHKYIEVPVGSTWFIISLNWINKWNRFCDLFLDNDPKYNFENPGPVDNSSLLVSNKLSLELQIDVDAIFISKELWAKFIECFNTVHSDCNIFERKALPGEKGDSKLFLIIPCITFLGYGSNKKIIEISFIPTQTIDEIKSTIKRELKINQDHILQIYVKSGDNFENISSIDSSLEEAGLARTEKMYLRFSTNGTSWSDDYEKIKYEASENNSPLNKSRELERQKSEKYPPGVCGLHNLGNTCFMNSALQCLSNIRKLTEYFTEKKDWLSDVNTTNVLGAKGEFAKCYAELVNEMWSGENNSLIPRVFKSYISKIAPQFSGFNQHDSQELMNAVLDGLHEDLNRIKKKPYVEKKDTEGRDDEDVANESWQIHKARNDSIIVDLFYGLLKSKVTCPVCHYVSLTFDPYVCLTLPLGDSFITHQLVYVWPKIREKKYSGRILKVVLKINGQATKKNIADALELVKPTQENYSYSVYFNPDSTNYYSSKVIENRYAYAFEVPNGEPIKLFFRNAEDSQNIGNLSVLNLPMNSGSGREVIATPALIEAQVRNLFSDLGLDSMVNLDQEFSNGHGENDQCEEKIRIFVLNDCKDVSLNSIPKNKEISVDKLIIEVNDDNLADRIEEISSIQHSVPLEIPNNDEIKEDQDFEKVKGQILEDRKVDIYDSFDKFISAEKLCNMNMWFCKKCKEDREAFKKLDIWTLPEILVLHLKRFKGSSRYSKDSSFVDYPVNGLNLTKYIRSNQDGKEYIYDLTGVSSHSGNLGFGHYTAYAKNFKNNNWYLFNDSSTSQISEKKVVDSSAYFLVYERRHDYEKAHDAVEFYSDNSAAFANGGDNSSSSDVPAKL